MRCGSDQTQDLGARYAWARIERRVNQAQPLSIAKPIELRAADVECRTDFVNAICLAGIDLGGTCRAALFGRGLAAAASAIHAVGLLVFLGALYI